MPGEISISRVMWISLGQAKHDLWRVPQNIGCGERLSSPKPLSKKLRIRLRRSGRPDADRLRLDGKSRRKVVRSRPSAFDGDGEPEGGIKAGN
jgi:hypothetical protein